MLAGRPPFLFESRMQMMMAHVMEHPPPLPESGGLEKLALKMLEKDPKERPASASVVIAEIEHLEARDFAEPLPPPSLPPKHDKRKTNPELLRFDTFPSVLPPAEDRTSGLPTIELSAPPNTDVVRRVWNAKTKSFSHELIPVLLVESDQDIAIEIERRLDQRHFRAHRAARLDAAFALLGHEKIQAIILDPQLPDCDGLEALDRLRMKADVPVVVVSKMGDDWLALDAIRRGAEDFLTCSAEELPRLQRALRFAMERDKKPLPRGSSRPKRPDSMTKRASLAKRRRSRVLAVGFGAMVFGIGLLAGLFISRPDAHSSNAIGAPRTATSTAPSR
jgi:CheY-like chemotaxis protein